MEINYYNLFKFLHIVFFTTWMAGLFYLPRLYVYHSGTKSNSTEYSTFLTMEKKLMKYIMNPSMILTWVFGVLLVLHLENHNQFWLNLKFVLVVGFNKLAFADVTSTLALPKISLPG